MLRPVRPIRGRQRVSNVTALPAPTGGWDAVSALASMPADRAIVLDNWFPTPSNVRVRRGHVVWANNMGAHSVETLMAYNAANPSNSKMFAICNGSIYDVTANQAATVTSITGLSNSRSQSVNVTTSGGHYLWTCNGADTPKMYDGSSWSVPSVTGITPSNIIHVNVHKNRLWFTQINSTQAAYLASGAISGAATTFELGGLFNRGGYLMAMATWTLDGGSGIDDFAVFISSRGQVAVYQGTDPNSADTWSLTGVYDLGSPLGRRCFTKIGGDLALVNVDGVLPLSKALKAVRGATANVALSGRIQNVMNEAARSYQDNFGWEFGIYPKGTMAILNVPVTENVLQYQYVMNTLTGAWCRFTGQNANCWLTYNDDLYFGTNDGQVCLADTGSNDRTATILAIGQSAYNYYKPRVGEKQWTMIQPLLEASSMASPSIGLSTDFRDNAILGTPPAIQGTGAKWDSATWDTDIFGGSTVPVINWTTIQGVGLCASVHFQASTGSEPVGVWGTGTWGSAEWDDQNNSEATLILNGFNILFQSGAVL